MEHPKCKTCGKRHRLGGCGGITIEKVRAAVSVLERNADNQPIPDPGLREPVVDAAPLPTKLPPDRKAYMREYMRTKYRPKVRGRRVMVAGDIGWPE